MRLGPAVKPRPTAVTDPPRMCRTGCSAPRTATGLLALARLWFMAFSQARAWQRELDQKAR